MNVQEAVAEACKKPTLLDALTYICVWESERVVRQAKKGNGWETCFKICIQNVMEIYTQEPQTEDKKINDGGAAFPANADIGPNEWSPPYNVGMTLRDWYAGMALQGLIINPNTVGPVPLSARAYELADAMIARREATL